MNAILCAKVEIIEVAQWLLYLMLEKSLQDRFYYSLCIYEEIEIQKSEVNILVPLEVNFELKLSDLKHNPISTILFLLSLMSFQEYWYAWCVMCMNYLETVTTFQVKYIEQIPPLPHYGSPLDSKIILTTHYFCLCLFMRETEGE